MFFFFRELLLNNNNLRILPYEIGKLFNLHVLGLHGNPLNKDIMTIYTESNGTHKLLTYMLDNLQGRNIQHIFFYPISFTIHHFFYNIFYIICKHHLWFIDFQKLLQTLLKRQEKKTCPMTLKTSFKYFPHYFIYRISFNFIHFSHT